VDSGKFRSSNIVSWNYVAGGAVS